MGQIKVVLIFNEDDERQREAGEYLKTKKRDVYKRQILGYLLQMEIWEKTIRTKVTALITRGRFL